MPDHDPHPQCEGLPGYAALRSTQELRHPFLCRRRTAQGRPTFLQALRLPKQKCDRVKLLYWDGTGLWILMKRLEQGSFTRPKPRDKTNPKLHLKPEALEMLLSGIDLKDGMQRSWYKND